MEKWKWIVIIGISLFLVYSSRSPISDSIKASIKSKIPDTLDNIFSKVLNIDFLSGEKTPLVQQGSMAKIGRPTIACSSDEQCRASYSAYPNAICNKSDGECYA